MPIPDPKLARERSIEGLEGEIPSPINPPSGCPFRTRCRFAEDICAELTPPVESAGEGRLVACHRWTEIDHVPSPHDLEAPGLMAADELVSPPGPQEPPSRPAPTDEP